PLPVLPPEEGTPPWPCPAATSAGSPGDATLRERAPANRPAPARDLLSLLGERHEGCRFGHRVRVLALGWNLDPAVHTFDALLDDREPNHGAWPAIGQP